MHSLFHSLAVPPGLSMCECGAAGSASSRTACPVCPTILCLWVQRCCCECCPLWLLISAPPTSLDECFFFISLVVGLPCSSIFCQFWLCFVVKLLLSFFWLCEEAQCVYLRLHLGRNPSCLLFLFTHLFLVAVFTSPSRNDPELLFNSFFFLVN